MELRDLYDSNRKLTGETIFKGEQIPEGRYILVVLVFIQNSEGKFLIQKRSETSNGKYATTGGHPKSGENSMQGILTEVEEEISLRLNPVDLQLFLSGKSEEQRILWDAYYTKKDIEDIKNLKLQKDEVDYLEWFSKDEITELMNQNKFLKPHYYEFESLLDWLKK